MAQGADALVAIWPQLLRGEHNRSDRDTPQAPRATLADPRLKQQRPEEIRTLCK
ncbi:MAG: hypothetical protein PHV49_04680 [Alistipes sp.]|nr:hypothetical protein [Alistipes sp.]